MLSPLHNAWYTAALQKCPHWPQRVPKREKETQGPGACPKHPEVCSVWWKTIAPTHPAPSSSCNVQDKHIKRCTRRIKKGRKRHNVVSELERGISNRNKGRNRRFSRRLIPAPSSPSKVPMSTKGKEIESWEFSPTPASLHWCELRQVKVTLGNIALKSLWNRSSYSTSQELSKRRKGQDWRTGRCSQEWDPSGVWPRGHFMGFRRKSKFQGLRKGGTQPAWVSPSSPGGQKQGWQATPISDRGRETGAKEHRDRADCIAHEWDRVLAGCVCKQTYNSYGKQVNKQAEGLQKQSLTAAKKT